MLKSLLLFPFGGNARESLAAIFAINEIEPQWEVIGFFDDETGYHGRECCGIRVLGGRELMKEYPDAYVLAVPGNPSNFTTRGRVIQSLGVESSRFATIIHPSVVTARDSTVGYNTLIMPNVVVSCNVKIGNHCVILPNTVISHDTCIADYCCIGSNISISGSVSIGQGCYIGSGTKMREDVTIGDGTLIGLGSNVISNVPDDVVVVGNPARELKKKPDSIGA